MIFAPLTKLFIDLCICEHVNVFITNTNVLSPKESKISLRKERKEETHDIVYSVLCYRFGTTHRNMFC